jgi:tripartite-type tricarboxylate transporter receptor subunit TctC
MGFRRAAFAAAIVAGLAAASPLPVLAQQAFPSKPVRVVAPFSPGGNTDVLARILTQKMSEVWGQPVVVENRTGAGGTIGTGIVAKATPDGHTLLLSSAAFVISAALHPNLPYDSLKDFAGVTRLGFSMTVLVATPSLGVKSVKDLIAVAQAKPGQIFFGSAGVGSSTHMNGERFRLAAGIRPQHVGFKGAADATLEIVAGRIHYGILGIAGTLGFIQNKQLTALAVGTPQRSPLLPDVPTIADTLPGYARDGSHSLLAPAGTPRAVLNKISKDVARILASPEIRDKLKNFDFEPAPTTPEEHDKILRADVATFSEVVKLAGLRPK